MKEQEETDELVHPALIFPIAIKALASSHQDLFECTGAYSQIKICMFAQTTISICERVLVPKYCSACVC